MRTSALILSLSLLVASALGSPECTVTAFNRELAGVRLVRFDDAGRLVFAAREQEIPIPQEEIIEIVWKNEGRPAPQEVRLDFSNQDVLLGKLTDGQGGHFQFSSPSCGEVRVTLKELAQLSYLGREARGGSAARLASPAREEKGKSDLAALVNGDALPCVVQEVGPDAVKIRSELGQLSIKSERLLHLRFAAIPGPKEEETAVLAVVESVHGELLTGQIESATAETLVIRRQSGQTARFPLETIERISFKNGAVVFLSDLEPERVVETPFFDVVYPYRKDRSVDGAALKLRGKVFRKGLGVHSKSELTYALDGKFSRVQAVIGIDDEVGKKGNVIFAVLGDGKELYRSPEIVGGADPVALDVKLEGVSRLTLRVDFGRDFHIADHADWADARLVR